MWAGTADVALRTWAQAQSDVDGCNESCDESMTMPSGRQRRRTGPVTTAKSRRAKSAQVRGEGEPSVRADRGEDDAAGVKVDRLAFDVF